MREDLLSIAGVTKSFGPVEVLHGIDLRIGAGEIVGLIGENGAGKSTLMNIVSGSVSRDGGVVELSGEALDLDSVREGIALGIRFVHQELSTVGSLSVAENIFLGDYLAGPSGMINRRKMSERSKLALDTVGLGHLDPNTHVRELSAGEQQLIEIAKAIVVRPKLLILDEPTSSLTPVESAGLFKLFRSLADDGVAVIFISHKLEETLELCDRVVVLRDGRLVSDEVAAQTSQDRLIDQMVGRDTTFKWRGSAREDQAIRLQVTGLTDAAGVLSPIDLAVNRGEVVALFGLVGAGRTEFLESVYGFRRATAGAISIDGAAVRRNHIPSAVAAGMFMVPEGRKTRGILPTHSIRHNISVSNLGAISSLGVIRSRAEIATTARHSSRLRIRMANALQTISRLSGGNQQKTIFARALMAEPTVLLLDEPTHGVDVGAKSEIYDIIHDLARDGISVLMASSELPEVLAVSDRCAVFSGGELVGALTRAEMSESKLLSLAFANH